MVERIDFTGHAFITTTYYGRLPLLIATLSNVMNAVEGAKFYVCWYTDEQPEDMPGSKYAESMLTRIADSTNNKVVFRFIDPETSVANSKRIKLYSDIKYVTNLDDDLVIPAGNWRRLDDLLKVPAGEEEFTDVVTIGVQDADNTRGFADFDTTEYISMEHFLNYHPPGKAKHHKFKWNFEFPDQKHVSQLYTVRRSVWEDPMIWKSIEETFTERGIRGYDIILENNLAASDYKITLLSGEEAIHIGLESGYLEGQWHGAHDIAKTVVKTETFNNG